MNGAEIVSRLLKDADKGEVTALYDGLNDVLRGANATNALTALGTACASLLWSKFPQEEWEIVRTQIFPHMVGQIMETWSMHHDGNHRTKARG